MGLWLERRLRVCVFVVGWMDGYLSTMVLLYEYYVYVGTGVCFVCEGIYVYTIREDGGDGLLVFLTRYLGQRDYRPLSIDQLQESYTGD